MKPKGKSKAQSTRRETPARPPAPEAPRSEKETLIALFTSGRFAEAESTARSLAERFPSDGFAWKAWGAILTQLGRNEEALRPLETALALSPCEADTLNTLGTVQQNLGRLDEAAASYRRALQIQPQYAEAHSNLGNALRKLGRCDESIAALDRALAITPNNAESHHNRGLALRELGRHDEALASFRRAVELKPDYADANFQRGNAASQSGEIEEALASFRRVLDIDPSRVAVRIALGNLLGQTGRVPEAIATFELAIESQPENAEIHVAIGILRRQNGELERAAADFRRAIELMPEWPQPHNNLGLTCFDLHRIEEARSHCERAIELAPDFAEAYNNLGNALGRLGLHDEALEKYQRALQLQPNSAETHNNYGVLLQELLRYDEAQSSFERAIELKPAFAMAHCNRGYVLLEGGRVEEGMASLRRALELDPKPGFYSSLLYYDGSLRASSPVEHVEKARGWERLVVSESDRAAARSRSFDILPREGRPLRIGISSAELGYHAVSYFLTSWMRAADRTRVQLFLYPTSVRRESETSDIRSLADRWTPLYGRSDADAAAQIRSDRIDVLIDTTAHMRDCRLGVFAQRAAPVQCHYIGYFGTTGLTEMDYFIADDLVIPPSLDHHFTETVWRLPRTWIAYTPLADTPPPAWKPTGSDIVRLGSFNNFSKLSNACLALWARVLNEVPSAVLFLKDRKSAVPAVKSWILDQLASHGVPTQRVTFAPRVTNWRQHMSMYDHLDIALDTIPFGSGTTGFDTLWMGVPLITLEGDWMAGRMGASMATALGRPEWIAKTEDEYVEKAVRLAKDAALRAHLRSDQQERVRNSPLCDAEGLARCLEDAFEAMFDRWRDTACRR